MREPRDDERHPDERGYARRATKTARDLLLEGGDREAGAALAAAVGEDLAATSGRHTRTEAVGADAAGVVGLISAFHGSSSSWGKGDEGTLASPSRQGGGRKHRAGATSRHDPPFFTRSPRRRAAKNAKLRMQTAVARVYGAAR